ncbi:MAG: hypothetical protein JXA89_24355 [Anaerolineae bacterium]|nr:hypothetical protein [Anaerolineae bacterium]
MDRGREPNIHEGDLWAWLVSFVVTCGLHVGIVLFAGLSAALGIYALTGSWGGVSMTQLGLLGLLTILALSIWGALIQYQVRGFRPHTIRGLGNVVVVTTGRELGEFAADILIAVVGVILMSSWVIALVTGDPFSGLLPTLLIAGLFVLVGFVSFGCRLWVLHRGGSNTDSGDPL